MLGSQRGWWALATLGSFVLGGCSGASDAAAALRDVEPHVAEFDRFDAWARRTLSAEGAIRRPEYLEEALFAPLVLRDGVADAWVVRRRRRGERWSLRDGAMPEKDAGWIEVRHPSHGSLSIVRASLPKRREAGDERCLVVSRLAQDALGRDVEVAVAFYDP